jgi:hypothetical protein
VGAKGNKKNITATDKKASFSNQKVHSPQKHITPFKAILLDKGTCNLTNAPQGAFQTS